MVHVYTSTYQYEPVCTSVNMQDLNFAFFEIRYHTIISLAEDMYTVEFNSLRTARVYSISTCIFPSMYWYVPVRTVFKCMYRYIPVHTGTYWYIPVCTILPDPVQVYRIPDVWNPDEV